MHFLFPSDPFERTKPDEAYAEEAAAFRDAGFTVSLFSYEDFESGSFRARPAIPNGAELVYRGWMLSPSDYARLSSAVRENGGRLRTSVDAYQLCHYLPEWYGTCQDLTPRTVFSSEQVDPAWVLEQIGPPPYFIKDYVKSLTTERGSIARSAGEIAEIVELIQKFRGRVEGGVCIREFVELDESSEERYFVINGRPMSRNGECPELVAEVARRVHSPFFSVDVASRIDGLPILIELGDGQVSDRKSWPADRFVKAFDVS